MELLSTADAAKHLGVTQAAILQAIKLNRLPASQVLWNRRPIWRILKTDLDALKIFNKGRPAGTTQPNPSGICMCGCGHRTEIASHSSVRKDVYKGEYARFVKGHNGLALSTIQYIVDPVSGCWVWQRHISEDGYGTISTTRNPSRKAHKVFFEDRFGPIPSHLEVDHTCKNRACVNPDHLETVTHAENNRRTTNARITYEIADKMRQIRAEQHLHYKVIGAMFGVTDTLVWRVCQNKSWVR
jgi:hypothetical protein